MLSLSTYQSPRTRVQYTAPLMRMPSFIRTCAGLIALTMLAGPAASGRMREATGETIVMTAGGWRAAAQGGRGAQPRVRRVLLAWADTRNGQAQHAFTSHAL